jgi:hypothetical protein
MNACHHAVCRHGRLRFNWVVCNACSLAGELRNGLVACPEGLEPPTPSLEGWCSIQLSYGQQGVFNKRGGRGGGIRTRDLLVPNQLRYQAALHPDEI